MAEFVQGVDLSVYQGRVDQSVWDAMAADGQRVAVVGSWHGSTQNPYAEGNLLRARRAGMEPSTYVMMRGGLDGGVAVDLARAACGSEWGHIRAVAIDAELDGTTKATIRQGLARARELGKRTCVYTGRWWWVGHFGNPTDFKDEKLWYAFYDGDPDIDFASAPFGGWTLDDVVGEQYIGTVGYHGTEVDRNSFNSEFWIDAEEEEEGDDMAYPLAFVKTVAPNPNKTYMINFQKGTATWINFEGGSKAIDEAQRIGHAEAPDVKIVEPEYLLLFDVM